jgi:hypothetical protein
MHVSVTEVLFWLSRSTRRILCKRCSGHWVHIPRGTKLRAIWCEPRDCRWKDGLLRSRSRCDPLGDTWEYRRKGVQPHPETIQPRPKMACLGWRALVCNFPICLFANGNSHPCRNLTSHNSAAAKVALPASQVIIAMEGGAKLARDSTSLLGQGDLYTRWKKLGAESLWKHSFLEKSI